MIYGFVFKSAKNVVRVVDRVLAKRELKDGTMIPLPGVALLAVNKQISSETAMILQETKSCTFLLYVNYTMQSHFKTGLRFFCNLVLEVEVRAFALSHDVETLRKFLDRVCQEVVKGHKKTDATALINVRIKFWDRDFLRAFAPPRGLDLFVLGQMIPGNLNSQRYMILHAKVQLQHMVHDMRAKVQKSLPNATFTTNANTDWPGIRVKRISDMETRFVDDKRSCMGSVTTTVHWEPVQTNFELFDNTSQYLDGIEIYTASKGVVVRRIES